MKKILVILFILLIAAHFIGRTQTTNFSFTALPFSSADILAPGRGLNTWNAGGGNLTDWPFSMSLYGQGLSLTTMTYGYDAYIRPNWAQLEAGGSGTSPASSNRYDWSFIENNLKWCIDRGIKLSFGILNMAEGYPAYGTPGGANLSYPTYIHNQMQALAANDRDYISTTNDWVPNWNSSAYLNAHNTLLDTLSKFIASKSYTPSTGPKAGQLVYYRDVVNRIDIRGYGNFGEWHLAGLSSGPGNQNATEATLKAIVNQHKNNFPNYQLVMIMNALDQPSSFGQWILNNNGEAQNNYGPYGIRRDNAGQAIFNLTLQCNDNAGVQALIDEVYKKAPKDGEPSNYADGVSYKPGAPFVSAWCGPCDLGSKNNSFCTYSGSGEVLYGDYPNQVREQHITSIGHNNYGGSYNTNSPGGKDSIIAAAKYMGYRLVLNAGNMSTTLTQNSNFNVTLNWKNVGIAPVYENWNTIYELRNAADAVVQSWTLPFKVRNFLPAASDSVVSNTLSLGNITPGTTYKLVLIIKDSLNYRKPLPLALSAPQQSADGSYLLRNNIAVQAAGNTSPNAVAGNDQVLANGVTSSSLDGSASNDPDGSISVYAWTKLSGPAGNTFGTPNAATTTINSLVTGTYVFRLTVTDNLGATGTDDVQVRVNALPTAAAGNDQTLGVGTTSTTLNASGSSDADGTISTYAWTKISGPACTITSPSASSTTITSLTSGVRIFRITVTDNNGGTSTDDVQVFVGNVTPYQLATPTEKPFNATGGHWTRNPERMVDGNTATSYQVGGDNDDGYDGIYYPTQNYFILDSNYNNFRIRIFSGNGNPGYGIKLFSQGFTDSLTINLAQGNTPYQNWSYVDTMITQFASFPVRVVELTVRDGEQDLTEIQFYGNVFNTSITNYFPKSNPAYNRNFLDFHGQNVNGDEPDSLYNTTRLLNVNGLSVYYDTTTNSSTLGNRPFIVSIFGPETNWQQMKDSGKVVYTYTMGANAANREVPKPAPAQGSIYNYYATEAERYKNIPYGSDSVNKNNWLDEYRLHAMLAGYFGRNASANMSGYTVDFKNGITSKGQDLFKGSEADNEDDRNWKDRTGYHNSQVKIVKLAGVYDSAKSKDNTWEITDGAMSNPDTQYIKGKAFWSIRYRGLNNYPADNIAFNYYVTDKGGQWPNAKGISPEKGNMLNKLKGFMYTIHNYIGNKKGYYREAGWDASPNTRYSAPTIAGISSRRVAAALYLRLLHIARAAEVDAIFQFTNRDESADQNSVSDFVTMGQHTGYRDNQDSAYKRWPLSYAMFMTKEVYKNYNGAPTVLLNGDSTGNWVLRDEPEAGYDTVTYTIWSARDTSATYNQVVTAPNGKTFTWIEQVKPEYGANDMGTGNLYGNRTTLTPGTSFSVPAGITPISVRVKEANISATFARPLGRFRIKIN